MPPAPKYVLVVSTLLFALHVDGWVDHHHRIPWHSLRNSKSIREFDVADIWSTSLYYRLVSYFLRGNHALVVPPRSRRAGSSLCFATDYHCDYYAAAEDDDDDDESDARSQFGTRRYWNDMYDGMGDFPPEEYSWYYGWDIIKPHFVQHVPDRSSRILVPGVGNDPILLDVYSSGYRDITAFDYSASAIERQGELLSYDPGAAQDVVLLTRDARSLDDDWMVSFDAVLEKGALDAIYLSGDGNAEKAAEELRRVIRPGGICVSVSGVLPRDFRREIFATEDWEWVRDGSDDLKAGCFVWRKR